MFMDYVLLVFLINSFFRNISMQTQITAEKREFVSDTKLFYDRIVKNTNVFSAITIVSKNSKIENKVSFTSNTLSFAEENIGYFLPRYIQKYNGVAPIKIFYLSDKYRTWKYKLSNSQFDSNNMKKFTPFVNKLTKFIELAVIQDAFKNHLLPYHYINFQRYYHIRSYFILYSYNHYSSFDYFNELDKELKYFTIFNPKTNLLQSVCWYCQNSSHALLPAKEISTEFLEEKKYLRNIPFAHQRKEMGKCLLKCLNVTIPSSKGAFYRRSIEIFIFVIQSQNFQDHTVYFSAPYTVTGIIFVTKPPTRHFDSLKQLPKIFTSSTWLSLIISLAGVFTTLCYLCNDKHNISLFEYMVRPILQYSFMTPSKHGFILFWAWIVILIVTMITAKTSQLVITPEVEYLPLNLKDVVKGKYILISGLQSRDLSNSLDRNNKYYEKLLSKTSFYRNPSQYIPFRCINDVFISNQRALCLILKDSAQFVIQQYGFIDVLGNEQLHIYPLDTPILLAGTGIERFYPFAEEYGPCFLRLLQGNIHDEEEKISSHKGRLYNIVQQRQKMTWIEFNKYVDDYCSPSPLTIEQLNGPFLLLIILLPTSVILFCWEVLFYQSLH